jgi:hypothetical protein
VDGSELEIRLSEWVITQALAQMTTWRASGLCLSVSINPGNAFDIDIFDAGQCPFGKWYRGIGERRYAGLPDFELIDAIHRRAHRIAEEIVERLARDDACAARARFPQLQTTCDALLEHIDRLAPYMQERAARPANPPPPAEPAKADYT